MISTGVRGGFCIVTGLLAYQITGWILGERTFSTFNSEALLFTFSLGSVIGLGWLLSQITLHDIFHFVFFLSADYAD